MSNPGDFVQTEMGGYTVPDETPGFPEGGH